MYEYIPPRQNNKAIVISILLFFIGTAAFVAEAFLPEEPWGFRVLEYVFIAIWGATWISLSGITSRYLVLKYLYRLRANEDHGMELEIFTYRRGNRMQLVYRARLSAIAAITPLGKENATPPAGVKRVRFVRDLSPTGAVVLSCEDGDGEIVLTPDERMLQLMQEAIRKPDIFDPAQKS